MLDVVVIGAGLSGLTAAEKLALAGRKIIVLEARDRVGGRTYSVAQDCGKTLDLGAQWIGKHHGQVFALAERLKIKTAKTYLEGRSLFHWSGRQHTYKGLVPHINPLALADFGQAQMRLDRLAQSIDTGQPWIYERFDHRTFEDWIRHNTVSGKARALLRLFTNAVFATEPANLSLLHVLFYLKSSGGSDWLAKVSGGAQETRFMDGAQQLSDGLAGLLPAGTVKLSMPVDAIEQQADSVTVIAGQTGFKARAVVCTVPPNLIPQISFAPGLPPGKAQLYQRVPAGSVIKGHLVYGHAFWRDRGLSGQVTSNVGPVKIMFDNSGDNGAPGVLTGFVEGAEAVIHADKSRADLESVFVDCAVRYFGHQAQRPHYFAVKAWARDPFAGGCYSAHFAPAVWSQFGSYLRQPFGRVYFAGTETASAYNGYMEGAIRSGHQVAKDIINALFS